ncbi:MAG: carbohydrate binding domain-containing protein [Melioribacteraceae bacterium]|nr:carbohydrate binding domain-containing protein [Melioribacteraceae bacterium]
MLRNTILCFLSILTIISAQTINVTNSNFEKSENNNALGWSIIAGDNITIDANVMFDGKNSLLVVNSDWSESSIISGEVELKVGHIYKLSAMVKSENAYTKDIKQYPTSVAGCITMESIPFTNHSQTVGSTKDWHKIETYFVATKSKDKVKLLLGYNGAAKGKVWFDKIELTKVEDINEYIPKETVKWFGDGYRYDDRGWIFVHTEGNPYERGYQYGYLVANDIAIMIEKLGYDYDRNDAREGWNKLRYAADALMFRKYDKEYLEEMKGIADGINRAGSKIFKHDVELLDVVTLNSHIDIDYAASALRKTKNPLSGRSFLAQEEELNIPEKTHKCSGFLANNSATADGRIVFGQIFMWGGYTGPNWNVIIDIVPTEGNRLVYQTYPGGIHSGADFYMNSAGVMIGETTVSQTPFNAEGTPMSNRIRKAAQYANNIDDVSKILAKDNNGMYTNDWLVGDTKTDEIGIFLLGTKENQFWKSSNKDFYGDSKDWFWSNNNNKSLKVRKEGIFNSSNAPYDLTFGPWNRDIAFQKFYKENYGSIDAIAGVNLWNSSPINRPHACDGKIVTSEMAEQLVFFAHYGKVTLREKFINENNRIPDWPNAIPRLTLGYSTPSPIYITEKLKEARIKSSDNNCNNIKVCAEDVKGAVSYDETQLWFNTVFPASNKENWFISGTSAYWRILNDLPSGKDKAEDYLRSQFSELNARYNYVLAKEGTMVPLEAKTVYNEYKHYQMPRIKGTYLLHQLRLKLGNEKFSKVMKKVHTDFRELDITTDQFVAILNDFSGGNYKDIVMQWLNRSDLPEVEVNSNVEEKDGKFIVKLNIKQTGHVYDFKTSVAVKTESEIKLISVDVNQLLNDYEFEVMDKPVSVTFNYNNDIPLKTDKYYTWSNFFDDYQSSIIAYGTNRQIEANHTLALRFSKVLADRFTETLTPVKKESEICEKGLSNNDLLILNGIEDNKLMEEVLTKYDIKAGKNWFTWNGKTYSDSDDGLFIALPNPYAENKAVYLYLSNSGLQLYDMTKQAYRMPSWALFEGDKIVEKGYHCNKDLVVKF